MNTHNLLGSSVGCISKSVVSMSTVLGPAPRVVCAVADHGKGSKPVVYAEKSGAAFMATRRALRVSPGAM